MKKTSLETGRFFLSDDAPQDEDEEDAGDQQQCGEDGDADLLAALGAGCGGQETCSAQTVDYAGQFRLNMGSETVKTEATVKTFVDGDTTHFLVGEDASESGVLRARYLAVNTPEITGKVEEYGKKASEFTKEKLSSAAAPM